MTIIILQDTLQIFKFCIVWLFKIRQMRNCWIFQNVLLVWARLLAHWPHSLMSLVVSSILGCGLRMITFCVISCTNICTLPVKSSCSGSVQCNFRCSVVSEECSYPPSHECVSASLAPRVGGWLAGLQWLQCMALSPDWVLTVLSVHTENSWTSLTGYYPSPTLWSFSGNENPSIGWA